MATNNEPLIDLEVFHIPNSLLENVTVKIGLDRGLSLTKVVYVPKESIEEKTAHADTCPLTCVLFQNRDFEAALDWIKVKALLPESGTIHITGSGGYTYRKTIKEKLELEVLFIEEFLSQISGIYFLVNALPIKNITYESIENETTTEAHIPKGLMKQALDEATQKLESNSKQHANPLWPALVVILGSGGGIVEMQQDGTCSMSSGVALAGKSFLGLAKLLIGTCDYDEIMKLAENGDRRKTDTQINEIFLEENNPYSKRATDTPTMYFGKAAEYHNANLEYAKEDVAASLVAMTADNIANAYSCISMYTGISQIYIGGNLYKHKLFRKKTPRMLKKFNLHQLLQVEYLKTGHTGAIGAMISKPEDSSKYFKSK